MILKYIDPDSEKTLSFITLILIEQPSWFTKEDEKKFYNELVEKYKNNPKIRIELRNE